MFCKDCPDIDICNDACLKKNTDKPILDRHFYEVRYLLKRGNNMSEYVPRVKRFNDLKKARNWAKKHFENYVINEFCYDANNAEYFAMYLIAWSSKK